MLKTFYALCSILLFVGCDNTLSFQTTSYQLEASTRSGMGSIPFDGGTMFRVWAPHAEHVFVAGDFNGWNEFSHELGNEFNGNFSADVFGANPGQRYKYVIKRGFDTYWKNDPRAQDVTTSIGESIIFDHGSYFWNDSFFQTPPFNEQIIYEMHIGTFNDSPGFGPGNFLSAVDKLDHLASLGVNMIELLPVSEFPGDFSRGYNSSFLFAPESAYGSPNDLKYFIDQAHQRGIGVIVDVVHNHYGPNDLPMWCFDGECFGSGGIYFYTDWRQNTPWGPRPDYGRTEVRDYIRDNIRLWLDYYHADGIRWDSTINMHEASGTPLPEGWSLLQEINDMIDNTQPWKIQIAEDFRGNHAITRDTSSGGAGFDSQWDGNFFHPILDTIIPSNDSGRNMFAVRDAITYAYNNQATQRVIYTESHDEVANGRSRVPEMIWPGNAGSYFSKKRSTLGAAIALTSPGIPMLFQGQEFLEDGYFADEDPLDWSKANTYAGIVQLYTDLIHLRRNWFNNTRGLRGDNVNVFHINNADKLIAYHRWAVGGPGDDVVIVANFSGQSFSNYHIGFPNEGLWYVRFNSDWNGYSGDFGNTPGYDTVANFSPKDGMNYSATVGIGPYSVLILSQ